MNFPAKHVHTPESVLQIIKKGPTKFAELSPSRNWNSASRKTARSSLDALIEQWLVKHVYIGRFMHYVEVGWTESVENRLIHIEEQSRHSYCGCINWEGYCDPLRGPTTRYQQGGSPKSVRRILWDIGHTEKLTKDDTIKMTCENDKCVNTKHMKKERRNKVQAGKPKNVIHSMRIAEGLRKVKGKLDMDKARAIRDSEEPAKVLAEKYGVSKANIHLVKRGKIYKEYPVGGFFSGLLAA